MDLRFLADVQPEQVAATWNVSGDCGMITPEGRFHALNAGNCSVAASATGTDGQKISGEAEITVLAGLVNTGVSNVVDLAESLNLPADEFTQCYNGESVDAVNSSINEGSTVFGINGTPGNVLLDRETGAYKRVFGASPVDTFENALAGLWSSGGSLPTITASKVEEVLTGAHFYGNPEARTVIIVYADLLCPYCKRHYNDQTIETIAANHPGEVAMVFKNFPLTIHPTASLGARGLYCAGKIGGDDIYYSYLAQAIQAYGFTD
jgi:protein-disulfide isomerase